jgi:NADH-quinone oxidoreductase subunit M
MNQQLLSLAIWLPILGAVPVFWAGSDRRDLVRWLALAVAVAGFLVTIPALHGLRSQARRHAVRRAGALDTALQRAVLPWRGRHFHALHPAQCLHYPDGGAGGWEVIEEKQAQYMGAFLVMSGLMNGIFSALDGVLFYVFFEASLIPMYIIIGVWGGPNRVYAAIKFFLYTLLGSLLMLVAPALAVPRVARQLQRSSTGTSCRSA